MAVTQSIKIEPADYALVKRIAHENGQSLAFVIGRAIRHFYANGAASVTSQPQGESHARDLKPTIPQRRVARKP